MALTGRSQSAFVTGVSEALPIASEATSSRVVVNNDLLRVVVFAMDAGQELTAHASPRAVVVQQLQGTMRFWVGDDVRRLEPGDVVYLAPGQQHALVADTACRFTLVMVDVG